MPLREYTRRINSNGEDVAPPVCACYYKAPQRQADNSGGYVLDFYKKLISPIESHKLGMVQCKKTNQETRTKQQGEKNGKP